MLSVVWQIVAVTVIVAVFGGLLWDRYLRGERTRAGLATGCVMVVCALVGGWSLAEGHGWVLALCFAGGVLAEPAVRAVGRRLG